jgi:starch phosphorylase
MKVEIPEFKHVPERVSRLGELAYNLWWSWHAEARNLFFTLDRALWKNRQQNPVQLLRQTSPARLAAASRNQEFIDLYDGVLSRFDDYMSPTNTWFAQNHPDKETEQVAYFSAEFAVHTSVSIYSGGLGLLAGDTCKEASDLGIPFVAIGAFYPEGYFRQRIGADGSQEAFYERVDADLTPLLPVLNDDGSTFLVQIPMDSQEIYVAVWKLQVGRAPIFLMDTDVSENDPWNRDLVARLYEGDPQVRLRQEVILGIGGMRVLRALGYDPTVIHLNEGHAAFASLDLFRVNREQGLNFEDSLQATRERVVFTTHTPVKAGHDVFPFPMIEGHFRHLWEELGISREDFLGLGTPPNDQNFSMTVLALNTARQANAVSRRHGEVSREMWQFLYPERSVEKVPITSITNGVHVPTWLSGPMVRLLRDYLGKEWIEDHDDPSLWERVCEIPDEQLWQTHCGLKLRLLQFIRERIRKRWMDGELSTHQLVALGSLLIPEALTLGFARRFATYKRATLIFRDRERIKQILHNPWCPVQLIFSGKAHPADEPGKFLLRQIYEICASPEFGGHVAFVEDYDKEVAHHLVAGVDVWLNNPEPPKEASGTSGQKASLNGVINCSILDGWWCEGYNGENGWLIGGDDEDAAANSIYTLLEETIVPTFYDRDADGVPRRWVEIMKTAISSTAAPFSARRMVREYCQQVYCQG